MKEPRKERPHVYTSELCNELLLWAWTASHVHFEDERQILELSFKLTDKYTEKVPIVDKGSMRLKLAKLSAAVAARTFSVDAVGGLYVRKCHVEYVYEFLDNHYSKPTFGYADLSKQIKDLDTLKDPDSILKRIQSLPAPRDFVEGALMENNIDAQFILLTSGLELNESRSMLSFLFRKRAVKRGGQGGRSYFKTSQFTTYLKKWESNGCLKNLPDHIQRDIDSVEDTL